MFSPLMVLIILIMADKQCVLSEDDIGSVKIEDELSSLTEITTLVGHQLKEENECRYMIYGKCFDALCLHKYIFTCSHDH
jgi:hypothetical protein